MRMTLGRSSESVLTQTRLARLRLRGVPSPISSVAATVFLRHGGKATAPPMPQRARRARSAALVVMVSPSISHLGSVSDGLTRGTAFASDV